MQSTEIKIKFRIVEKLAQLIEFPVALDAASGVQMFRRYPAQFLGFVIQTLLVIRKGIIQFAIHNTDRIDNHYLVSEDGKLRQREKFGNRKILLVTTNGLNCGLQWRIFRSSLPGIPLRWLIVTDRTAMDIVLLKTFLEVARIRHFGRAAATLFITQSAVSARIKLLESALGVQLFSRKRNDIQLTPAGLRLVRHAEIIVKGWDRARQEIALDETGAHSLAVGSPFDLWGILLREWSTHMRRQAPQLVLQIEVQPAEILVARLVNGLLDLALLFEPPQMPDLAIRQVAEIPLLLVSGEAGCGLEQALHGDYYMVDWGSVFALSHAELFPDIPSPTARFTSGIPARDLILSSGGCAYLAEQMVQQELEQGQLYRVADAPVIERTAFVVYRPGAEKRTEMRQALDALKQTAG